MDYFYIIVSSVALVLLILILTFIGIAFSKSKSKSTWPPVAGTCPDYWDVDQTDKNYCLIPSKGGRNTGGIYNESDQAIKSSFNPPGFDRSKNRINFNDSSYTNCNKQIFASKWGIYWDGYSNITGCGGSK